MQETKIVKLTDYDYVHRLQTRGERLEFSKKIKKTPEEILKLKLAKREYK